MGGELGVSVGFLIFPTLLAQRLCSVIIKAPRTWTDSSASSPAPLRRLELRKSQPPTKKAAKDPTPTAASRRDMASALGVEGRGRALGAPSARATPRAPLRHALPRALSLERERSSARAQVDGLRPAKGRVMLLLCKEGRALVSGGKGRGWCLSRQAGEGARWRAALLLWWLFFRRRRRYVDASITERVVACVRGACATDHLCASPSRCRL